MALVYVIDDAADYRFLLGRFIKKYLPEHSVRFFEDGSTFCQRIDPGSAVDQGELALAPPQLILLDFHMPELNGAQTMACIHQFPQWESVPVIILSGSTDNREIETCYEAGATAVVNKAASWQQLGQTIQAALTAQATYRGKGKAAASHQ